MLPIAPILIYRDINSACAGSCAALGLILLNLAHCILCNLGTVVLCTCKRVTGLFAVTLKFRCAHTDFAN